jgi:hypothetical protein
VQGITEDASARGVLRSTLPVDARQALTSSLGGALQQSMGELGARQASDISGVRSQLGDLGLKRVSSIADLSRALETQDLQRQQFEQQKLNDERSYQLAQAQASAKSSTSAVDMTKGYTTKKNAAGGQTFFGPGNVPITAAQFFSQTGRSINDLALTLQNTPGAQKAYKDLAANGFAITDALIKKYPYIFGGV